MPPNPKQTLTRRIRLCIRVITIGLFLSGVTAFPIETELRWLVAMSHINGLFRNWLIVVYHAVEYANLHYPFLSYGTDWLAFTHVMLAVLFAGALKDPVKNRWVVEFGIIAAIAIFPLAFIAGGVRGIPIFWR